ncbi:probable arginine--tRNA ligase, mitochondrial isoform X1 [Bicyclus anynana]|uniref:Probable arginine--tRNA ligase, mitochondrial n=1 Tax=Bicyclus anynana TaxID=110368 RepID=A0A6J1N5T0_BICAN|nr:probable arginine--tRNA ligase, mitochondrial isoform X1 [Bicyclus anynana]
MGTRLKNILLNQTNNNLFKNEIVRKYDKMHITYRNKQNIFTVNLSYNSIQKLEKKNFKHVSKKQNEQVAFNVDRNTFLKKVIDNIKEKPELRNEPKKIVIDFSSPNIAKPFHMGHLRSTIIGNFVANIHEYFANDVVRLNYLGDWGTQFGLLQYGLESQNIAITQMDNPLKKLYEVYVEANKQSACNENVLNKAKKYFSDIEQGRADLGNWRNIREITVKELDKVYQRLGIKFDEYHWESNYNGEAIKGLIANLEEQNIVTTEATGAKVVKVKDKNVTILKSDNSTLYLSRDIAALLDRYKRYRFDKMLYVVDNAQTDHFATVFDIVRRLDKDCTTGCEHVKFGRIKGMSTRTGNVVFLSDILDEAKEKMYYKQKNSKNTRSSAINEETCDILGSTAVIINDLKQRRQKDYIFDWDKALQSEGDSGIKLQYLHCRLWSLESKSGVALPNECDPSYLNEEVIVDVVAELARFDDVLNRALEEYEPCIIVNYLFKLARHVNRMFNELQVKNVGNDLGAQRLLVFHSARLTIKKALDILGVKALLEM